MICAPYSALSQRLGSHLILAIRRFAKGTPIFASACVFRSAIVVVPDSSRHLGFCDNQLADAVRHSPLQRAVWWRRWWFKFKRTCFLCGLFVPLVVAAPLYLTSLKGVWLRHLVWTLEHAGCTFIKLGQWASMRPDLLPRDVTDALQTLQSQSPQHGFAHTQRIFREAFPGRTIDCVFDEFPRLPVASGSVGQVYKARLRGETDFVAVKVRHPDVEVSLAFDLDFLFWLSDSVARLPLLQWLRIPIEHDEFVRTIQNQVDFREEARSLSRFRANFAQSPGINVAFPCPHPDLQAASVLVESWEDGTPVSQVIHDEATKRSGVNRALAFVGYHTFVTMMLVHNFMHADCHSGNLLARNLDSLDPQLVVLDAGIVTELRPDSRRHMAELLKCVVTGDGRASAELFLRISKDRASTDQQRSRFTDEMTSIFHDEAPNGAIDGTPVKLGIMLRRIIDCVQRNQLTLQSEFAAVIVSVSVLEGLAAALHPEIDLIRSLVPYFFDRNARSAFSWQMIQDIMASTAFPHR